MLAGAIGCSPRNALAPPARPLDDRTARRVHHQSGRSARRPRRRPPAPLRRRTRPEGALASPPTKPRLDTGAHRAGLPADTARRGRRTDLPSLRGPPRRRHPTRRIRPHRHPPAGTPVSGPDPGAYAAGRSEPRTGGKNPGAPRPRPCPHEAAPSSGSGRTVATARNRSVAKLSAASAAELAATSARLRPRLADGRPAQPTRSPPSGALAIPPPERGETTFGPRFTPAARPRSSRTAPSRRRHRRRARRNARVPTTVYPASSPASWGAPPTRLGRVTSSRRVARAGTSPRSRDRRAEPNGSRPMSGPAELVPAARRAAAGRAQGEFQSGDWSLEEASGETWAEIRLLGSTARRMWHGGRGAARPSSARAAGAATAADRRRGSGGGEEQTARRGRAGRLPFREAAGPLAASDKISVTLDWYPGCPHPSTRVWPTAAKRAITSISRSRRVAARSARSRE